MCGERRHLFSTHYSSRLENIVKCYFRLFSAITINLIVRLGATQRIVTRAQWLCGNAHTHGVKCVYTPYTPPRTGLGHMTDYIQKWQDFRGLRRNMIILAAVGFFGMTGAMFLKPIFPAMKLFTPMNFALAMMLWMNWIILVVSLEGRIASWPCPRCEKAFCGGRAALREARSWSLSPAQCSNCGLHKNAESAGA